MQLIGLLAAVTLYGILKNASWGFLGAWFFVILAPSSSFLPIQDPIFEHRMYLSLAAIVAGFVLLADAFIRMLVAARAPWSGPAQARVAAAWFFGIIALALGARTIVRNSDYWSEARIWRKVLDVYPQSQRAMQNLGDGLAKEGKHAEALEWFEKLERILPDYADGQYNVAVEYSALGQKEEALTHYARVLELSENYPKAHTFMGEILRELHRDEHALEHYEAELRRDPNYTDAHFGLGAAQEELGNKTEALTHFARALELDKDYPEAHYRMGKILLELQRKEEAAGHFEAALRRDPHNDELAKKLAEARTKGLSSGAVD
jgi:tetratricopeptide (TPR) repeat protein